MSRANPAIPPSACGLLLVEGGDERAVCQAIVAPATWSKLLCWNAHGRNNLPSAAAIAARDANFASVHSIGILLDAEDDPAGAEALAGQTITALGGIPSTATVFSGTPRTGFFVAPTAGVPGCIETLCRRAVRSPKLTQCANDFVTCSGPTHATVGQRDKAWLNAYISMLDDPDLRFHQENVFADHQGVDPAHAAFAQLNAFLVSLAQ